MMLTRGFWPSLPLHAGRAFFLGAEFGPQPGQRAVKPIAT